MSLILHTGFGDNFNVLREYAGNAHFEDILPPELTASRLSSADLVLLGPYTKNILKAVQTISRMDKSISTIVLPEEKDFQTLKQSLLFTPYVSKDAAILHFNNQLREEIPRAAQLTRQKRKFAKVAASIHPETVAEPTKPTVRLEHLGNFLDQAPIGAIILNEDFKVVATNVFLRQMFNVTPLTSIGTLNDILDKASVDTIKAQLSKSARAKLMEVYSGERYFEIHFAGITNEKSEDLEILLINDITERRLELQRIRNVLDSLPQMAWTTNAEGDVTYLTNGWYSYTGQNYSSAMDGGWFNVIHGNDREEFMKKWQAAVNDKRFFETEARYLRADGEYRWHLVRSTPMLQAGGKVSFWIGTCTDVHEQKEERQTLSAAVKKQNTELIKVNELLKKSNDDLQQFAFVASHDLKEPIRKMKIFLQQFQNAESEKTKQDYLERINRAAARMSELIDGIMAYSQVSGGNAHEDIDLNLIVENVLVDLEVFIKEKEVSVKVTKLPRITGIKIQVHQLFSNLILNAIKYNQRLPEINISAVLTDKTEIPESDNEAAQEFHKITISDNGIGFEKKYAQDIFTMFKRLHSKDQYTGAGIGLALVKKIVANHGGYITVNSEPGKGSDFSIYLPVKQK